MTMSAGRKKNIVESFRDLSLNNSQIPTYCPQVDGETFFRNNDLSSNVSEECRKKSKRSRRNRKTKRPVDKQSEAVIETVMHQERSHLKIKAMTVQICGSLYRKRNCQSQIISTKFYENDHIYNFKTNLGGTMRGKPVSNETRGPGQTPNQHGTVKKLRGLGIIKNDNLQSASTSQAKKPKKKKSGAAPKSHSNKGFQDYIEKDEAERGLKLGVLVKGVIRINPKNHRNAYVPNSNRSNQDYFIPTIADRNRALEGDIVVIEVKPEAEWRDNMKSAGVVYIYQKVHPRTAVGSLSTTFNKGKKIAAFLPRDLRVPRMIVYEPCLPQNFMKNSALYENVLYKGKIVEWTIPQFAHGLVEKLGEKGKLTDETKAILCEHELDIEPFPPSIKKYLPISSDIPKWEFAYREDLRKECIFTIDPATAKDLDDAVSCRTLPNGHLEIGVHIADVSYFLLPDNELDEIVAKKATTIYLVDQVFHMLPVEMCMHLSLLPGKDCLAFSVFWEMTPDGDIVKERFTRTIINSCCQLAYEHAQKMIDNEPIDKNDFPNIYNKFKIEDLSDIVKKLQRIGMNLRRNRFANGALRIDQVKISFKFDERGEPAGFYVYENTEAHRLIEEFMLLANVTVANRITTYFPDIAFLRCHEPPNPRLIGEVQKLLGVVGIHLDTSSSGALHSSLEMYNSSEYLGVTRSAAMYHLLAKPMTRARYFCSSLEDNYSHYALSIPIYTHFTSPIRRYADVIVHRLLAATLGYTPKPTWTADYIQSIAANCNKQKYNAKRAGEAHSDLFLAHYVENNQPFIRDAVVVDVREKFFDALVLCTGSIVRIQLSNLQKEIKYTADALGDGERKWWRLEIQYPPGIPSLQVIEIFQVIRVALKRKQGTNSLEAELLPPL